MSLFFNSEIAAINANIKASHARQIALLESMIATIKAMNEGAAFSQYILEIE